MPMCAPLHIQKSNKTSGVCTVCVCVCGLYWPGGPREERVLCMEWRDCWTEMKSEYKRGVRCVLIIQDRTIAWNSARDQRQSSFIWAVNLQMLKETINSSSLINMMVIKPGVYIYIFYILIMTTLWMVFAFYWIWQC